MKRYDKKKLTPALCIFIWSNVHETYPIFFFYASFHPCQNRTWFFKLNWEWEWGFLIYSFHITRGLLFSFKNFLAALLCHVGITVWIVAGGLKLVRASVELEKVGSVLFSNFWCWFMWCSCSRINWRVAPHKSQPNKLQIFYY